MKYLLDWKGNAAVDEVIKMILVLLEEFINLEDLYSCPLALSDSGQFTSNVGLGHECLYKMMPFYRLRIWVLCRKE